MTVGISETGLDKCNSESRLRGRFLMRLSEHPTEDIHCNFLHRTRVGGAGYFDGLQ